MAGPAETKIEEGISTVIEWLRLGIETVGAFFVAVGIVAAVIVLLKHPRATEFNLPRLTLARYLVLALEFQLAADILSTAVAPTWDKIGKLGAIAVIRTLLNHFLIKEMQGEKCSVEREKD